MSRYVEVFGGRSCRGPRHLIVVAGSVSHRDSFPGPRLAHCHIDVYSIRTWKISTLAPKRSVAVVRRITCGPTRGSVRAGFYAISNAQGCVMGETLAEGCRGVKTRTEAGDPLVLFTTSFTTPKLIRANRSRQTSSKYELK